MSDLETRPNAARAIIFSVLALSLAYAVVRYAIAGPVPWKGFPFFILSKMLALAAFILLALKFGLGPLNNLGGKVSEGWLNVRKALSMTGFRLALIHTLMSSLLINTEVYGSFFGEDRTLTLIGGISMLGGAHVSFMGYQGWLAPAGWHGGIPQMSRVAFTAFFIMYLVNLAGRK